MKTTKLIVMLAILTIFGTACEKENLINKPGNLVPKTVDQDPSLPSITVNGAMLHSEAYGHPDSTLVICLHGGPGRDYRYILNCMSLANYGYRVVFYDQRGSGLSQRFSKKSYTDAGTQAIDALYKELTGVISHYRTSAGQKVYLLGISWGGIFATGFAAHYPEQVQGLVVCEPGGYKWDDIMEYMKTSRTLSLLSEHLNDVTYIDQFLTGKEDEHELLDYKMAMISPENEYTGESITKPGSFWRCGAMINEALIEIGNTYKPDFSSGINNYNKPVLFMYSSQNQAYPASWAQKMSGVFNTVKLKQVTGTGHYGIIMEENIWLNITMPEILNYFNSL